MFKKITKRKIFNPKKTIFQRPKSNPFKVISSRINGVDVTINSIIKEIEPMEENVEKSEIRILYKKCLTCNFIVPWEDSINECADDPECPSNRFSFVKGRDPERLIQDMSEKFAECLVNGEKENFMEHLKRMIKDKALRDYVFDVFALSIEKVEEKSLEKSVNEPPI